MVDEDVLLHRVILPQPLRRRALPPTAENVGVHLIWSSAAEPALGVEDLSDNPGSLVTDKPANKSCGILRFPEPVLREPIEHLSRRLVEVAGVHGSRVDCVEHNPLVHEVVRD